MEETSESGVANPVTRKLLEEVEATDNSAPKKAVSGEKPSGDMSADDWVAALDADNREPDEKP